LDQEKQEGTWEGDEVNIKVGYAMKYECFCGKADTISLVLESPW